MWRFLLKNSPSKKSSTVTKGQQPTASSTQKRHQSDHHVGEAAPKSTENGLAMCSILGFPWVFRMESASLQSSVRNCLYWLLAKFLKLAVTWISSGTSLGDPVKILQSSERDCRPWPSVAPGLVSKFDASDEGRSMHATSKLL